MKITIVGWYGTETIGDRAILGGLLKSFSDTEVNEIHISLGCLNPFYSQRMVTEDARFFREITNNKLKSLEIFDSKDAKALKCCIKFSDLLVIGGGPLMDLPELNMLEYSFKVAKKLNVKRAILGCGVGPLFLKNNRALVGRIVKLSNLTILRDNASREFLLDIKKEFGFKIDDNNIHVNFDPAVNCTFGYLSSLNKPISYQDKDDYIAVNLRSFPKEYDGKGTTRNINEELTNFISDLADKYNDKKIVLVPMHYFHVGSDDRQFLNEIKITINKKNVEVQNEILTLEQTLSLYEHAYLNIGMRFHSVVLQTIVAGNNYILDYTEPNKGKIYGFISDVDSNDFYMNRYICLQNEVPSINELNSLNELERHDYNESAIKTSLNQYSLLLMDLFRNENINC